MSQHSRQRTSVDLLNELESEGSHYTKVALAVGFENTTRFIFSGADDNLTKLNAMMLEGGEPVGFLAYHSDGGGNITFKCRALEEYADAPWAHDYLEHLTHNSVDLLVRDHGARLAARPTEADLCG